MAAATASSSSARVRYAPDDPTLPKPWRGLVDSNTGYLYFWNPETKVTQYERPVAPSEASSVPPQESLPEQQPSGHCSDKDGANACIKVEDNGSDTIASGVGLETCQTSSGGPDYPQNTPDVKTNASCELYATKGVESGSSVESYRRQHEITVTGANVPQPFISFQATGFPAEILREMQCAGFAAPTPIQAQSWPIALRGRDIVAIAKTGSGKTLGYLIPGFLHLKKRNSNPKLGPTVLVLSPTRELATQIQDEAMKFGKTSKISCTCLYGGAPKGPQLKDLDRGVNIVVATPGRLNDIMEMRRVSLHQVSYLVLDEADRMLDMGFEPQIRKIVKEVPSSRQTLMYTATWPKEVRRIAADLLSNPVQVNIGNVDELAANKSITQYVEVLSPMDKRRRLEQILRSQEPGSKIIIFCSTKKMCDHLSDNLTRQFGAAAIHGDKCQSEREHILNQFRTGRSPVLVATDVAARGLDVKDIRVVINYDFPTGIEDYVHRIGRTGRAGATGLAYTFFCSNDERHASDLIKLLERADQNVPAELRDIISRGGGIGRGGPRRWSSSGYDGGHSGNYNSSFSGKSGGWGAPSSSDRDVGDHDNNEQHNSSFGNNTDASGSAPYKSFHESMMAARSTRSNNQSCSTISPARNSGWGENHGRDRSRSPSPERFGGPPPVRRSFHETMMLQQQQARPANQIQQEADTDGVGGSYHKSSTEKVGEEFAGGSNSNS
ncbi:ATP-dependent RNA helicase-like protein DB10 [Andrographis paniculata]|uniref:ATP-dependent RNA helicase-like protein DB10 n=1 Tax=Andrographis paniculata TaxID=175694 RepID=UPI0021E7940E|nr:ATP-dependent RNA helicase-like protein DB10 [Andrographis paniculata]XP_051114843.1 ATP-dependent RNA helicase-like protein DB10 [Andrographis paniculata]XP_051114844.1 ATP-dependent RNA helicase-like protein DB10 [Andrographis paniculata]XP_051114845.1 ATP-dependent RNA helicase-like protein DB10 [Andrographis paniculata]XP_051114846.1 ATP-dependent RNA helicase-like protein DB10 [Andrographis paniculata]